MPSSKLKETKAIALCTNFSNFSATIVLLQKKPWIVMYVYTLVKNRMFASFVERISYKQHSWERIFSIILVRMRSRVHTVIVPLIDVLVLPRTLNLFMRVNNRCSVNCVTKRFSERRIWPDTVFCTLDWNVSENIYYGGFQMRR